MYVVLTTEGGDEAVRRRQYNALERLYRTLDREPPAYTTAETAAKMQGDAKDLQFWEGEALLVAAKVGRVVSSANQAKLMASVASLEAAEEHLDMVMSAITAAEEGIYAVLGTMGVVVPPDPDDVETPNTPTPEMEAAPMYPAAKGTFDAAGLRDWLGANNEH
jgi:predicted deacylase